MKQCDFCGKASKAGNAVSHSHKKTKRTFNPNLFNKVLDVSGKKIKVKICANCLKKIGK